MPSPMRAPKVEREYEQTRPRDAAIRMNAANDNSRVYANDNSRTTTRPTVDQEFEASYARQGLQPSVGTVQPIRNIQVEQSRTAQNRTAGGRVQAAGAGMRAAGSAAQAGGATLRTGGVAVARVGAALSTTGLGAIVGAPLIAAGAGMAATGTSVAAAGKATDVAGKTTMRRGRQMNRMGQKSILKPIDALSKMKSRAMVTRINMIVGSWCFWLWIMLQFPAAIMSTIFLGFVYIADITATVISYLITVIPGGSLFRPLVEAGLRQSGEVMGFNLFLLAYFIAVIVGLTSLLLIGVVYRAASIDSLFGNNSTVKITAFVIALCLYIIPVLNIFPWFYFWMLAVWSYPE